MQRENDSKLRRTKRGMVLIGRALFHLQEVTGLTAVSLEARFLSA